MNVRRTVAVAIMAVSTAVVLFIASPPRSAHSADAPLPSRIVILIDVDTLRADRMGIYGYARPTSPALDRLFADGLVAERAITSAGWTLPAHASLFSSRSVAEHGVRTALQRVPADVPLLAEILSKSGVRCLGIQSGGYVDAGFGFSRGFDRYLFTTDPIERKVQGALRFVDQAGPGRLFLFLHSVDVHNFAATERGARALFGSTQPLGPHWTRPFDDLIKERRAFGDERIAGWLSARYDAALRDVDDSLGALLAGLEARGLKDRTAIVFTSDHGEELGERPLRAGASAPAHGHTIPYLYEEHVRVPFAVRAPWRKDLRGRVADPVSTIDVAPTILDLFDVPIPRDMDGIPLGRKPPAGRTVVSEAPPYGAVALVQGSHKVIARPGFRAKHWETGEWIDELPAEECFDVSVDPGERRSDCAPPWARRLLADAELYVASSFPGDLVVRAEPHGGPCRLNVAPADAEIRFFGAPPGGAAVPARGGVARIDLERLAGPVWIAIHPDDEDRSLGLSVSGCGGVRAASGEALPRERETSWSDLLWRGAEPLPPGTVVFSTAPGAAPSEERADYPAELAARLRALGYVTPPRRAAPLPRTADGPAPRDGRIRIRVGS